MQVYNVYFDYSFAFRSAYVTVLKICKLMTTTVGHAKVQVAVDACSADSQTTPIPVNEHNYAVTLQQALIYIPNPTSEFTLRNVAIRLGQQLKEQVRFKNILMFLYELICINNVQT